MKYVVLIIINLFVLISCSEGVYGMLGRSASDPEVSHPLVNSFSTAGVIETSWEVDDLADAYVLYRAADGYFLDFVEVYRGTELDYVDTNGVPGDVYFYGLAKVRGSEEFDMSSPAFGLFNQNVADSLEPNNDEDEAISLQSALIANIYTYQSIYGLKTEDDDWYKIVLEGHSSKEITISIVGDTLADGDDTGFLYSLDGGSGLAVLQNRGIELINGDSGERTFLFKIYPDPVDFLPVPGTSGGDFKRYRIALE
ncbi:MAG: hypothetical protein JXR86_17205 [Spirochaetales bacterium]|nr:hypothetical protein [Spirochaetales bacterium]